jgi:1,4-dihydroxy-6-naphthoate synthase
MDRLLRLGYSPCPNDTYVFYGLASGRIDTRPYRLYISLADVEVLNQQAGLGLMDVTKVSISAVPHLLEEYRLLRSGGAMGRGCGPLVVAARPLEPGDLRDKVIATPGRLTTARLLLQLTGLHKGRSVEMSFEQIMPAVAAGTVDAGVIIHEGRFTYSAMGLELVLDLGAWWEQEKGLPLPLGGILIKRSLGKRAAEWFDGKIQESLRYGQSHPEEAWPYILGHAQEMAPEVIRQHIDTFVNEFSLDVGDEGEQAIRLLLSSAAQLQGCAMPAVDLF